MGPIFMLSLKKGSSISNGHKSSGSFFAALKTMYFTKNKPEIKTRKKSLGDIILFSTKFQVRLISTTQCGTRLRNVEVRDLFHNTMIYCV